MTLQACPIPSDVAWMVDGFLFGLLPEGSVNALLNSQIGETEEVTIPHIDHDPAAVVDPDETSQVSAEMEEVTDGVPHIDHDPAAIIDPEEASQVSAELWAGSIERLSEHVEVNTDSANGRQLRVLLLTFGRHPKELEDAIEASDLAQVALRAGVDIKPVWANVAKILAEGIDPSQLEPPTVPDEGLKPYHVVLWEKDEEALLDGLRHLPYNFRKLNPGSRGRTIVPNEVSLFSMSSSSSSSSPDTPLSLAGSASLGDVQGTDDDAEVEITIKNTFIHVTLAPVDTRSIRTP